MAPQEVFYAYFRGSNTFSAAVWMSRVRPKVNWQPTLSTRRVEPGKSNLKLAGRAGCFSFSEEKWLQVPCIATESFNQMYNPADL